MHMCIPKYVFQDIDCFYGNLQFATELQWRDNITNWQLAIFIRKWDLLCLTFYDVL